MLASFSRSFCPSFFFFNDTATTEIYTLSLHDALPIFPFGEPVAPRRPVLRLGVLQFLPGDVARQELDRKSTRLNSSHLVISYAVFCLKENQTNGVSTEAGLKTTSTS